MRSTRSNRNSHPKKTLADIKSYSTCLTLELPPSLCCDRCLSKADPLINKRQSNKRFRNLSERRRCLQLWESKHNKESRTTATLLMHNKIRSYLKIGKDVIIDYTCVYENNKNNYPKKTNITNTNDPSYSKNAANKDHQQVILALNEQTHPPPFNTKQELNVMEKYNTFLLDIMPKKTKDVFNNKNDPFTKHLPSTHSNKKLLADVKLLLPLLRVLSSDDQQYALQILEKFISIYLPRKITKGISERIVGNISNFVSNSLQNCKTNDEKNAVQTVLTACLKNDSDKNESIRQVIGVSKGTFYKAKTQQSMTKFKFIKRDKRKRTLI